MFLVIFRDVSSVELLMNNHQGIKAEIDARNDSFTTCIELGKSLLARKHYASEEVPCSLRTAMGSWGFFPRENPALCHPQNNGVMTSVTSGTDALMLGNQGTTSHWWVTEVTSRFKVSFSAQKMRRSCFIPFCREKLWDGKVPSLSKGRGRCETA